MTGKPVIVLLNAIANVLRGTNWELGGVESLGT
jgi:hypothetical protein